jgi:hypothetical protein
VLLLDPAEKIIRRDVDGILTPFALDKNGRERQGVWAPHPGAQPAFLECPVFETLAEGNRGGGKTAMLIVAFAQHCGKGYGSAWRGIIFRRHYKDLEDVWLKCEEILPRAFPGIKPLGAPHYKWIWPTGERLTLAQVTRVSQTGGRKGHEYPFIAFEELTEWEDDECYLRLMATCRAVGKPGMPRMVRSTTNPAGPGHNWVKDRFRLPLVPGYTIGPVIDDEVNVEGEKVLPRVAIHTDLRENKSLLHNDHGYRSTLVAATQHSEPLRRAWLGGDWTVVSGGMFDDVLNQRTLPYIIVPNIPLGAVPKGWKIDRAFDYGFSKPFSVGWWATSNGEPTVVEGRTLGAVPGDKFRIAEWYGWTGRANEGVRMGAKAIARGILERERDWGLEERVDPGPADTSIFDETEPKKSIAGDMAALGVRWTEADKSPGSRKQGWLRMHAMLKAAVPGPDGTREEPGLFVCERCAQFRRTVPVLQRDEKDPDDVNTKLEDHVGDETRYELRSKQRGMHVGRWK